ncbi:hypothetical protein F5Y18DRAFT_211458 [Xylariaceae sp. FL1019]|nr:hypothetical protein F5Y18DRAFT_211458 [Xylariaceae sp. FL1019]
MPPASRPSRPSADPSTSSTPAGANPPSATHSDDDDSTDLVFDPESPADGSQQGDDAEEQTPGSSRPASSAPLQKRRRVTRACDECRRKKIKCDGKQPCTHCQVYSYECTYDKPSNRRRNPAPQYIEALENKLSRAEALLRKFMPDVDLNDPELDPSVQQEFRMREQARQRALGQKKGRSSSSSSGGQLQSMITSIGQLDLDEKGDYDFHGNSSGSVFFKRMKDHFRSMLGKDYQIPLLPRPPRSSALMGFDAPRSTSTSLVSGSGRVKYDLPAKERALALCSESLDNATCLLRIVHKPSFYGMLDRLYQKPRDLYETEDKRNLALAFAAMALGCMYNVSDNAQTGAPYKLSIDEALHYYGAAKDLLQDITAIRDVTSLQALLFMILFMQSISNLSTCYGFVGIALRSALRLGLHRHFPPSICKLSPIESETRRRVFYICRQMDTYVSALLGFPLLLNDDDIDQLLPTTVDDQFVTREAIVEPPAGTPSFFEAFNAHVKLMDLLGKVVKQVYPLKRAETERDGAESADQYASYDVSYTKIKAMEEELQQWNENLPEFWRPSPEGTAEVVRVRNLLRFTFAHVQMVLYRPFLHYVSPRLCASKTINERAYACGAAGINVARNILRIGTEMRKQVSLVGPYWFTLFSEFFAIISLVFFVLENQDKPGSKEILSEAIAGKEMIDDLAKKSMIADRVSASLETVFSQLPGHLEDAQGRTIVSRKRPVSSSNSSAQSVKQATSTSLASKISKKAKGVTAKGKKAAKSRAEPIQTSLAFENDMLSTPEFGTTYGSILFSPLDVSAASQGPSGTVMSHDPSDVKMETGAPGAAQQIHRLDAIMFSSDDPLAYPSQPRSDFQHNGGLHNPNSMVHHDMPQYYVPQLYDGIEGQLLGPLPPYFMHSQTQPGFHFPSQMFSDPMLSSQQMHPSQHHPQQRHPMGNYEDMNAGNWPGMFP